MTSELIAFTEYEEEICFDLDDPDFATTTKSSSVGGNGTNLRTNALTCSMEARVRPGENGEVEFHFYQNQ
ncbi:hypothetical protein RUM44_010481 [Polyplax serrata]|uniref:Uncharacterized protein n=1 Tax=Polyplax serrata TaxID=468196 RepID=A0ABR1AVM6_POLSC